MGNKTNQKKSKEGGTGKRGRPIGKNGPKGPYVPTGRPRGRPVGPDGPKPRREPTGNPRGRKPGCVQKKEMRGAHFRKPKEKPLN